MEGKFKRGSLAPPQTASQRHRRCWWSKWAALSAFIPPTEIPPPDSQRRARMEVLKETVEEEEAAEREEAAVRAERGEKMTRPVEVRREEAPMTQEMLRDLEKKLSDIDMAIPEKPSCVPGWGLRPGSPDEGQTRAG